MKSLCINSPTFIIAPLSLHRGRVTPMCGPIMSASNHNEGHLPQYQHLDRCPRDDHLHLQVYTLIYMQHIQNCTLFCIQPPSIISKNQYFPDCSFSRTEPEAEAQPKYLGQTGCGHIMCQKHNININLPPTYNFERPYTKSCRSSSMNNPTYLYNNVTN